MLKIASNSDKSKKFYILFKDEMTTQDVKSRNM